MNSSSYSAAGVGRTDPMCSLPSFAEPVLSAAGADSPPLDPIRTMFEHLVASMDRIEARMDDYFRRPPSSRQPARPDPEPPYSRPLPRSLEVAMPFVQPFPAVSVATQHLPATAPFMDINEGFRPNPSGASGSRRTGPAERLIQQELQSTWDLPPASRPHSAWDNWRNRFSEPPVYSGGSSWDPPGQRKWLHESRELVPSHQSIGTSSCDGTACSSYGGQPSSIFLSGNAMSSVDHINGIYCNLKGDSSQTGQGFDNTSRVYCDVLGESFQGEVSVENNVSGEIDYSNSNFDSSFVSDSPLEFHLSRGNIPQEAAPSDLDFLVSEREQNRQDENPHHVDVVITSDTLTANSAEINSHEADSYSTSWVTQMEYSYDNARDFGFSECRVAEEDRCDERERVHSTDSIFETKAKEALVHDVATSDTEDVTIPTSDLPAIQEEDVHVSKNVVEARDKAEPVIENPTIIDDAPKKSYAPIAMHLKVTAATLSRFPASVFVPFLDGKKVFVPFIDMSSTTGIDPHSVNVCGNIEGSRSIIRWAFDPGGVISPKLLFRTLFVVSWFPP